MQSELWEQVSFRFDYKFRKVISIIYVTLLRLDVILDKEILLGRQLISAVREHSIWYFMSAGVWCKYSNEPYDIVIRQYCG